MPPHTAELSEELVTVLAKQSAPGLPLTVVDRAPSRYQSTFPLEEILVLLPGGLTQEIVFKDLSPRSLPQDVRQAKPEFLYDPLREIETYRSFLPKFRLGTAHCYGASVDERLGRYWLFLEMVRGDELYKIGEFSTWISVARWMAEMHQKFASSMTSAVLHGVPWLNCDGDYFRLWMRRAREQHAGTPLVCRNLNRLARDYDQVANRLTALPTTLIHGEFYASNVLIAQAGENLRICPIDWEMAGIGPGLIDLAALVSGSWTDTQRTALALAYFDALGEDATAAFPAIEIFLQALDDCRLHLAMQWLGWSAHWNPPVQHAQDWLEEALHLAEKNGYL